LDWRSEEAEEAAGEAFDSSPRRYIGVFWAITRFVVNLQIAAFGLVSALMCVINATIA
jgi:hypothetical protein